MKNLKKSFLLFLLKITGETNNAKKFKISNSEFKNGARNIIEVKDEFEANNCQFYSNFQIKGAFFANNSIFFEAIEINCLKTNINNSVIKSGLKISSSCKFLTIQNCVFEKEAKQLSFNAKKVEIINCVIFGSITIISEQELDSVEIKNVVVNKDLEIKVSKGQKNLVISAI